MTSSDGGDTVYDIYSIIQSMAKNFQAANMDDGDYLGEDGLLVCGKCHTPKQYRLQLPGDESRTIVVPITCKHRQDELKGRRRTPGTRTVRTPCQRDSEDRYQRR